MFVTVLMLMLFLCGERERVRAMSEDQIGEFDWHRENIGYLENTVHLSKSVIVSTSHNVLASLNTKTGEHDWRVILPSEGAIDQFVVDKTAVYTLSRGTGLVDAWALSNGEHLWSQFLRSDLIETNSESYLQQITLESILPTSPLGSLLILYSNCFFALSPVTGHISSQFCELPTGLLNSKIPNLANFKFTFHKLFTLPENISSFSKPVPIVSGEIEFFETNEAKKKHKIVISITANNRAVSISEISVYPETTPSPLFLSNSNVFTFVFRPESSLLTVSYYSPLRSSTSLNLTNSFRSSGTLYDYSVKHYETLRSPLIEICSLHTLGVCVFVAIQFPSDQSVKIVLNEISSCQGKDGPLLTTVEYDTNRNNAIKNILCLSTLSNTEISLKLISSTSTSPSYLITESSFSFPPSFLTSNLNSFSFSTYLPKSTTQTNIVLKICIQNSVGTLLFLQQGRGVRWTRQESLSSIRQGVILDNTAVLDTKGLTTLPSFQKRLHLQLEDIQTKCLELKSSFLTIPSTLTEVIYDFLPPKVSSSLFPNYQPSKRNVDVNVDLFGFNKISVQLTSRCPIDGSVILPPSKYDSCLAGINVIALDLVTGSTLWSFTPDIISSFPPGFLSTSKSLQFTANLLKIRLHSRASHPVELGLVISLETLLSEGGKDSLLLTYQFHGLTGDTLLVTHPTSENELFRWGRKADHVVRGVGHVKSIQLIDTHVAAKEHQSKHTQQSYQHHGTQHYLFLHSNSDGSTVSLFPPLPSPHVYISSPTNKLYTHQINLGDNEMIHGLTSFEINFQSWQTVSDLFSKTLFYLYSLQQTGSIVFRNADKHDITELGERIISVMYPQSHEPIHQMAKVLGDDSLLLKYLNPHLCVIVTERRKEWTENEFPQETTSGSSEEISPLSESDSTTVSIDELYVTVVDTVSAQIVYRGTILHGVQPVTVSLIEHTIAVSYWNNKAQRFELSSIHLFEGMIGKYGLGPTSSSLDPIRSSFNSPPPIALQKSYILHRGITAMHHTMTERGITNKNLLLGLSSGQILALDTRVIDPRRPMGAPSVMEKEEGLMQYMPFLMWTPLQVLTVNTTLPPIHTILSASSHLESTSLVLSYGLDVFFTRATPSKGFDMLASDFNKPLLALIVGGMAFTVMLLKNYNTKKILSSNWK